MSGKSAFDNSEDLVLAHYQQVFAVDFHSVAAGVRAEHNLVAHFHGQCTHFTVVQYAGRCLQRAISPLVGFFSSRTWQDDTASGFLFFFAATDDDAVMQRTKLLIVDLS